MSAYPLLLELAGRQVVVVGGGPVAARRVRGLVDAGARVSVVAPWVCEAVSELVAAGTVGWLPRDYAGAGDLDGAWLVHTATGDPATDAAVRADAEALRVLCVDAGQGAAGTAQVPAVARVSTPDGPVTRRRQRPRRPAPRPGRPRRRPHRRSTDGSLPLRVAPAPARHRLGGARRRRSRSPPTCSPPAAARCSPPPTSWSSTASARAACSTSSSPTWSSSTSARPPATTRGRSTRSRPSWCGTPSRAEVSCGSRAATRTCSAAAARSCRRARQPASPSRSCRASPARCRCRRPRASRSPTAVWPAGSPSSPGTTTSATLPSARDHTLVLLMAVTNLPATTARLVDAGRDPGTPVAVVEDGYGTGQRVTVGRLDQIAARAAEVGRPRPGRRRRRRRRHPLPALVPAGLVNVAATTFTWPASLAR